MMAVSTKKEGEGSGGELEQKQERGGAGGLERRTERE